MPDLPDDVVTARWNAGVGDAVLDLVALLADEGPLTLPLAVDLLPLHERWAIRSGLRWLTDNGLAESAIVAADSPRRQGAYTHVWSLTREGRDPDRVNALVDELLPVTV